MNRLNSRGPAIPPIILSYSAPAPPHPKDTRVRIALVSREVSPFYGAGIGAYVTAMARAWAAAGHEVHLLTPDHPGLAEGAANILPGVHIHTLNPAAGMSPRMALPFQRHAMSVLESLRALHAASPLNYIEFPDYGAEGCFAIAAHRTSNQFAGAVMGVRLHTPTRECRELNEEPWLDEHSATAEAAEDSAIRGADVVMSPSRSLLDLIRNRLSPITPGAIWTVVPYPFDTRSPADIGAGEAAPSNSSGPTVLYIGRLERRKGVDLLMHAARPALELGARFRFIGGDTMTGPGQRSMLEHLRSLLPAGFEQSFSFDGPLPRHQVGAAIQSAAASGGFCCFPSRWENYPNVCLEAMALGAPVLGSDAGGMSEIIEHQTSGLLFRSGDAEHLSQSLVRLLKDASLRKNIANAAPRRITTACDPRNVVDRTIEVIARAPTTTASASAPRLATIPSDRLGIDEAPAADWIVILDPKARPRPELQDRIAAAIKRTPGIRCLIGFAEDRGTVRAPAGFDRDLLTVHDSGAAGFLAVDRSLIGELSHVAHEGSLWQMSAVLAAAGHSCLTIPEVLIEHAPTIEPADQVQTRLRIAQALPNLASSPGRALRLFDAVRREQLRRLQERFEEAQARATQLETRLSQRRYRLADRINDTLKALRLR